jgi:hypothetical protein
MYLGSHRVPGNCRRFLGVELFFDQRVFRFALDVAAASAPVAVDRGQVLTGHWVEDEHCPLKAAKPVGPLIARRDIAATEMHEKCFAAMMNSSVGKDIADIFERQISLCQASPGVLRNHSDSRFSHRFGPP